MKKNLLTSFVVSTIALSLSVNCLAQEATIPGGRVGPTVENANALNAASNTNANGNIPIGGMTTYNPDTGMLGFDPALGTNTSVGDTTSSTGRVGPTIENANALNAASNTNANGNIPIGGMTTYNPDTGMFGFDPTSWTDINVGTTTPRTDPLTNGWSNTVGDTLSKGGQGVQYQTNRETFNSLKEAYKDSQR